MHPTLVGFWTTAGPSGVILFALFLLRDWKGLDWVELGLAGAIPIVLWSLPVLGMIHVYWRTVGPRPSMASERRRRKKLKGGLIGLVCIFGAVALLAPMALRPLSEKEKPMEEPAAGDFQTRH